MAKAKKDGRVNNGGAREGAGRPKAKDKKVSRTIAIKESEFKQVKKQYGSLTKAYEEEIKPKLTTIPTTKKGKK